MAEHTSEHHMEGDDKERHKNAQEGAILGTHRVGQILTAEFLRTALPDVHARLRALGFTPGVACVVQEPMT